MRNRIETRKSIIYHAHLSTLCLYKCFRLRAVMFGSGCLWSSPLVILINRAHWPNYVNIVLLKYPIVSNKSAIIRTDVIGTQYTQTSLESVDSKEVIPVLHFMSFSFVPLINSSKSLGEMFTVSPVETELRSLESYKYFSSFEYVRRSIKSMTWLSSLPHWH